MPLKVDPTIFKAYDIRGKFPDQVNVDLAEQVARALVADLKPQKVVVARDVRPSGVELLARVTYGLTHAGADVIDIGEVSTDAFYYACAKFGSPGIMVTASHNPKEDNGFKMVKQMPNPVVAKEFMPSVTEGEYADAPIRGKVEQVSIIDEFIDHLLTIINPDQIRPLKVVIDTSNGAQGPIWQRLAPRLPITVIPLCFEPDGSFPNHGNDVSQAENQTMLREAVIKEGADVGLIFDPDGDRCLLVDDSGRTVPGDFITALLAVSMLERQPGSTIVFDIRSSDVVPDLVKQAGGKPFPWKPGHAYIKPKMQEFDAVFGGEITGHYFFKDFWFADCGLLSGLTMLAYISKHPGKLSQKISELERQYIFSPEVHLRVSNVDEVLRKIKAKYHDADISELSGVALRYPTWHAVVRPSDNEPLLKLTIEADTRELMETKRSELLEIIRG